MAIATHTVGPGGRAPVQPATIRNDRRRGDRVFRGVVRATGFGTPRHLVPHRVLPAHRGFPAFRVMGWKFFTTSGFSTIHKPHHLRGAGAAVRHGRRRHHRRDLGCACRHRHGTVPDRVRPLDLGRTLIAMVDLGAAIPSIIFGLWALYEFQPNGDDLAGWCATSRSSRSSRPQPAVNASFFIAGLVVGLMIVPIVASVTREVFTLAPPGERRGPSPWVRPLADDPDRRPALRTGRHDRRRHARPRPGPGGDDRRGHHPG